jgi:biotin synthase-like enzyme
LIVSTACDLLLAVALVPPAPLPTHASCCHPVDCCRCTAIVIIGFPKKEIEIATTASATPHLVNRSPLAMRLGASEVFVDQVKRCLFPRNHQSCSAASSFPVSFDLAQYFRILAEPHF